MNREFLEKLGLEKEAIDQIMKEHGKSIQSVKPEDYEETKKNNQSLNETVKNLEKTLASKEEKYKEFESNISELNGKVKTYETKELKLRIAHENQIPFELAERLSGATEEEIKADAEKLSSFVAKKSVLPLKEDTNNTEANPYKDLLSGLKT
jgi:predicted patatin/cPLA2 family phospholipase